jgi:hypothetical protein
MKYIVLLLAGLAALPVQAEVFRWVDKAGKVHYGDAPPADGSDAVRKKLSSEPAQNEDFSYEARRAQQHFPVTLYVTEDCGEFCTQGRKLLSKRGIPFSEKMLRSPEELDAFKALSGYDSVPALAVGKSFLKGFLEAQWNSELDIAGYPKTAPYRMPKAPAAPVTPVTRADAPAPEARSRVVPPSPE